MISFVQSTVRELDLALEDLVNWERFAIYLPRIKNADVQKIKRLSQSVDQQKSELYDLWLRKYPFASLEDVIDALEHIGENTLANAIGKRKG